MVYRIISKPGCPHCVAAKELMKIHDLTYVEDLRDTPEGIAAFIKEGFRTFPQIWNEGVYIGGADDFASYLRSTDDSDDF